MTGRYYKASTNELEVLILDSVLATITDACQANTKIESGGILTGHYDGGQTAIVDGTWTPPDSSGGPSGFYRGRVGLCKHLRTRWDAPYRSYYLGEWHSHPALQPEPSGVDRRQMFDIAESLKSGCEMPLLLIAYLNVPSTWEFSVWLFEEGHRVTRLHVYRSAR